MKNKKCPIHTLCFGYRDSECGNCEISKYIDKLHKKIDRLKKQNETLTIQRNAWALTAKAIEIKHGEWINTGDKELDEIYSGYKCSVCGFIICGHSGNYCSECGAKMDGEREK